MKQEKVSKEEFVEILKNTQPTEIHLVSFTDPKIKKTGNPFKNKKVIKRTEGDFLFGGSFKEKVEEKLDQKGLIDENYEVGSLPWGKWVEGAENKVIEHKGEYYMRYYPSDNASSVEYFIDDAKATDEEFETIKQFLPTKKVSQKQLDAGLEAKETVKPLVVNFSNIVSIRFNDTEYIIE